MTKRQAWLHLARAFKRYHRGGKQTQVTELGLCFAVSIIRTQRKISYLGYTRMRGQLHRWLAKEGRLGEYMWNLDRFSAAFRANQARRFAR